MTDEVIEGMVRDLIDGSLWDEATRKAAHEWLKAVSISHRVVRSLEGEFGH